MDDRQIAQIVDDLAEEIATLKRGPKASPFNLERHGLEAGSVSAMFDPRMAFELAVGVFDPLDVAMRYDLTQEQFKVITEAPAFQRVLAAYQLEIQEKGISIRLKAKLQLDHLLGVAFDMATDPLVPANVRADLIKWHADLADEMPKKQMAVVDTGGGGTHFSYALHITMTGEDSKGQVYDGESKVVKEQKAIEVVEADVEIPLVFAGVPEAEVKAHSEPEPEEKKLTEVEDILRKLEQHHAKEREAHAEKMQQERDGVFAEVSPEDVAPSPPKPAGFDIESDAIRRRARKMAKQMAGKGASVREVNKKFKAADDTFGP